MKPDTAVCESVLFISTAPAGVDIICQQQPAPLLLSGTALSTHSTTHKMSPPDTINSTFMVSLSTALFSIEQSAFLMRESFLLTHANQIDDRELDKCVASN